MKVVSLQETCLISKPAKKNGSVGKKKHLTQGWLELGMILSFLFYEHGLYQQHAK